MKKLAFFLLIFSTFLLGCKKVDSYIDMGQFGNTLASGSWRISHYQESGGPTVADFTGYVFTFTKTGGITAVKSGVVKNGSWGFDDDNQSEFKLDMGSEYPLDHLSRSWIIISQSVTDVVLNDDSGNSRLVHFTKI